MVLLLQAVVLAVVPLLDVCYEIFTGITESVYDCMGYYGI